MQRARASVALVVTAALMTLATGCTDDDVPGAAPTAPARPARTPPPEPPRLVSQGPPVALTVLQYNIQFADAGIAGVAADIERSGADVVLLNEIDDRRGTGGIQQAERLGRLLGMEVAYDPNGDVSTGLRGNAVLTSYDVVDVRRHRLPHPDGTERRGLMRVTVREGDVQLQVWTTHLNPDVGTLAQARRVRTIIGRPDCTTVFGGDLNTKPDRNPPQVMRTHLGDLWRYVGDGPGGTNRAGDRRIDYLYFSLAEPVGAVVAERGASDHRGLVGTFLVDPRENC